MVGLKYENYLVIDDRFYRPAEVVKLKGDTLKSKKQLRWVPKVSFEELVCMMVRSDLKTYEQ